MDELSNADLALVQTAFLGLSDIDRAQFLSTLSLQLRPQLPLGARGAHTAGMSDRDGFPRPTAGSPGPQGLG